MGTLGKSDNDKMCLRFGGTPKWYQTFKEAMIKRADTEGCPWAFAGGNAICSIFQAANAKVAKSKSAGAGSTRSSTGRISLNITTYDKKEIKSEFEKASVMVSVTLSVRKNRKEALLTHFADPEKARRHRGGTRRHERAPRCDIPDAGQPRPDVSSSYP